MTFVRKYSGDRSKPIVAVYTCPVHGEFDAEVQRDENGEAPDVVICSHLGDPGSDIDDLQCCEDSVWTPSPVAARVRRIEAVRGKWEKPERNTYLDTRDLGEGQDPSDFWAKRKQVWDERRREKVKALLR